MAIKFSTNVPQELRLRFLEGKEVESQFGGVQHMFSAEEGAFYVSDTVGRILAEQLRKLNVRAGEPIEITKREVSNGNGRKGIQWTVERVGFAPGEQADGTFAVPAPPASELERQLAASIEQAQARKQPQAALASTPRDRWAEVLLAQTNALTDVLADALRHSSQHGGLVKSEDVRSLMLSVFINLSKRQEGRNAA